MNKSNSFGASVRTYEVPRLRVVPLGAREPLCGSIDLGGGETGNYSSIILDWDD